MYRLFAAALVALSVGFATAPAFAMTLKWESSKSRLSTHLRSGLLKTAPQSSHATI